MMNNWQEMKTANARLFYIKGTDSDLDFHRMERLLAEALSHAPRLATAHKYFDLYFERDGKKIKFGREVIGYNSIARVDEELYGYDLLEMGQGLEIELMDFNLKSYVEIKKDIILEIEKLEKSMDLSMYLFRIRFSWAKLANNSSVLKAFAQILRS